MGSCASRNGDDVESKRDDDERPCVGATENLQQQRVKAGDKPIQVFIEMADQTQQLMLDPKMMPSGLKAQMAQQSLDARAWLCVKVSICIIRPRIVLIRALKQLSVQEESSLSISGADLQIWLGECQLQDELSLASNGVTGAH